MRRIVAAAAAACALAAVWASSAQAYVYWSNAALGGGPGTTIGRADLDGSGIDGGFVADASDEDGIAVDGSHIYWANDGDNAIGRANLDGSDPDPTFIPSATSGLDASPAYIATDGTYIYWTDGQRYVGRAALDGSGAQPHFLDIGSGSYPEGIAVSSGTVYVGGSAEIVSIHDSSGSKPAQILTSVNTSFLGLAIRGDELYFSEIGTATGDGIWSATVTGTGLAQLVAVPFPAAVTIGGTYLYWTANTLSGNSGTIGRGLLTSSGLTMIEPTFISGSGNPGGVAVDALIDPTNMTVSCLPADVAAGSASTCTATVHDSASSSPPTGAVAFSGSASTFFSGSSSSCTLHPQAGGVTSCTVGAVSIAAGPITIAAAYAGDPVHGPSGGSAGFCAGTAAQCSPPPAQPRCIVPRLKRKTLAQARRALGKAHCRLGKVTKPKTRRGRKPPDLVVGSTKPGAGAKLANGGKIAVKLVAAPVKKRKR
jgi:hypothetical protein